jgi:hypothetical protein
LLFVFTACCHTALQNFSAFGPMLRRLELEKN